MVGPVSQVDTVTTVSRGAAVVLRSSRRRLGQTDVAFEDAVASGSRFSQQETRAAVAVNVAVGQRVVVRSRPKFDTGTGPHGRAGNSIVLHHAVCNGVAAGPTSQKQNSSARVVFNNHPPNGS